MAVDVTTSPSLRATARNSCERQDRIPCAGSFFGINNSFTYKNELCL